MRNINNSFYFNIDCNERFSIQIFFKIESIQLFQLYYFQIKLFLKDFSIKFQYDFYI